MTHLNSDDDFVEFQQKADEALAEAEAVMEDVRKSKPLVLELVETAKKRRSENHFARDYDITVRVAR